MEMTKRSGRGLFDVPCCHLAGGTEVCLGPGFVRKTCRNVTA